MTDVRIIDAEVLRVGPDEVLVVKLPGEIVEEHGAAAVNDLAEAFNQLGLKGRAIVVAGDIEFAVVSAGRNDVEIKQ